MWEPIFLACVKLPRKPSLSSSILDKELNLPSCHGILTLQFGESYLHSIFVRILDGVRWLFFLSDHQGRRLFVKRFVRLARLFDRGD